MPPPARWNNQAADMAPHNKLLGVVVTVLGFIVLALAVAVADAMKDPAAATELSLAFPWPSLALLPPGMSAESLARDPLFYAGFVACFGWWWVLLGRPAFATKA